MLSTRRLPVTSLTIAGVVALSVGAYNLLLITFNAASFAAWIAEASDYMFVPLFTRYWLARVRMDAFGIAVPVVTGVGLLVVARSRGDLFGTGSAVGSRVGSVRSTVVRTTGLLCWIPVVGLPALDVVRFARGLRATPWSYPAYLALLVVGALLFVAADLYDSG